MHKPHIQTHYIIYQITNNINGKTYIGQHTTANIDDGYMGSGIQIKRAISKYGKQNFTKQILHTYDNFEDMNSMEKDIVNADFISRSDTYNIIEGGWGKVPGYMYIVENGTHKMIKSCDYDDKIHTTFSTGFKTVFNNVTHKNERISVADFNPTIHQNIAGGIVSKVDGISQYVSRDQFESQSLRGLHVGKVTAYDKETKTRRHIPEDEFHANRDRYTHNTQGFAWGTHKITGKKLKIPISETTELKDEYTFSTSGQITVFDILDHKFKNVPSCDLDPNIHKRAKDRKFIWRTKDGDEILHFFGGKRKFLSTYNLPESVWVSLLTHTPVKSTKHPHYNGSYFEIIDWKKQYNLTPKYTKHKYDFN